MKGKFRARAKEWGFGRTSKGNEHIAVLFEITAGELVSQTVSWRGFFTEQALDRTLESLRHCGWSSDSIVDLDGLEANEVEIVVDEEEYEGKIYSRVKWVNRATRLAFADPMDGAQLQAFAAKLRGKCVDSQRKYRSQGGSARSSANDHAGTHIDFSEGDAPF